LTERDIPVGMDPITAALCGLGAVAIATGGADATSCLLLFLGLWGVRRATRSPVTTALLGVPAAMWLVGHLFTFTPARVDSWVREGGRLSGGFLEHAPDNAAAMLYLAALLVLVVTARARIGAVLAITTCAVLGFDLLCRFLPSEEIRSSPGDFGSILLATERGWSGTGVKLAAICVFVIGVGPLAVQPLPRRGGAIAGAIGAMLLVASTTGATASGYHAETLAAVTGFFFLVASILLACGAGAIARAGGGAAGWIGVGLVVLGLLSVVPSLAILSRGTDTAQVMFGMATPFALLGLAIALFGWKGAPLEAARKLLAAAFAIAFVAGTLAWFALFLSLLRVTDSRAPWRIFELVTRPTGAYALVSFAALLLYLAAPPQPQAIQSGSSPSR